MELCGYFEIHVCCELLIIERILRLKYHAMFELELVNVTISRHKVRKLTGNKFCEIPTKSDSIHYYLVNLWVSFKYFFDHYNGIYNEIHMSMQKKIIYICVNFLLCKVWKICFGFYFIWCLSLYWRFKLKPWKERQFLFKTMSFM